MPKNKHGRYAVMQELRIKTAAEGWRRCLQIAAAVLYKSGDWQKKQGRRAPLEAFIECYKDYLDSYTGGDMQQAADAQNMLDVFLEETGHKFARLTDSRAPVKISGASADNACLRIGAMILYYEVGWQLEQLKEFESKYWEYMDGWRAGEKYVLRAVADMKKCTGMEFKLEA